MTSDYKAAAELAKKYPFAVFNFNEGWKVIKIDRVDKLVAIGHLRHDTSRADPTLVADTLAERHDPNEEVKQFFHLFLAFYENLSDAVDAIAAFERQYGWQREHIRECKKAVELAKRNLHSAEQSQKFTAHNKLDRFKAAQMRITY